MRLVFDLEADGFLEEATKVWCICFKRIDPTESKIVTCGPDGLGLVLGWMDCAEELIGHNIINYDLPLLKKLYGWEPKPNVKITDTVVMSRLLRSDRRLPTGCPGNLGPHSLGAWGYRVGRGKPDHTDWTQYSSEMLHRCSEDVAINVLTLQELEREAASNPRIDWTQALELEQNVSRIITTQELNGCPLDVALVWNTRLKAVADVRAIDEEVVPLIPEVALPKAKQPAWPSKQYKKDGTPTVQALRYYGDDFGVHHEYREDHIIRTAPINLGSDKQVKQHLLSIGWQPTEWNYQKGKNGKPIRDAMGQKIRTSPKLTLDSLESCTWPDAHTDMGEKIVRRLMLAHRTSMLAGWLRDCRGDGRISARAIPMGTPTGRMTHRQVVNVPRNSSPMGEELRSCFTSVPGYTRVGIDLKGCQLRALAGEMKDEEFKEEVVNGSPHEYSATAAGLEADHKMSKKDKGKKFNYSILFGASDAKVASDLGMSRAAIKQARARFFNNIPMLDALLKRLKAEWKQYGYIKAPDGRAIWVRSEHMLLVYLMQAIESVVMKTFITLVDMYCQNYDYELVTTMHDEVQYIVKDSQVNNFVDLAEVSIKDVNEKYNLWCPQAIDVNLGTTWAECH